MARIEVVTKAMWIKLTAALTTWQADRKNELEQARATTAAQGTRAEQAANAATAQMQQVREDVLKLAPVDGRFVSTATSNPRIPTVDEWNAAGGHNSNIIGSRLTDDGAVQYIKYNGASGGWDAFGTPTTSRQHMTNSVRGLTAQTFSAGLRLPRTQAKLRSGQPIKILGIGSSSMDGYNVAREATAFAVMVAALQARYPGSVITAVNKGVSGTRIDDNLEPNHEANRGERADLVVIMTGLNEANNNRPVVADYQRRLEGLMRSFGGYGADVLLLSSQWYPNYGNQQAKYDAASRQAAANAGAAWFDRHGWMRLLIERGELTERNANWTNDGFHMSDLTHNLLGKTLAEGIHAGLNLETWARFPLLPRQLDIYPPIDVGLNAGAPSAQPGGLGFISTTVLPNQTRTLSCAFVGVGIRAGLTMGPWYPASGKYEYRIDEGPWQPLAVVNLNGRVRGGYSTLADGLVHGLHLCEIRFTAGADAITPYFNGWEILCDERFPYRPSVALAGIYGPYRTLSASSPLALTGDMQVGLGVSDNITALHHGGVHSINGNDIGPAPIAPGDSQPRIDAVVWRYGTKLSVIKGSPGSDPQPPAVDVGVVLAHVRVAAGATTNAGLTLIDKRQPIPIAPA